MKIIAILFISFVSLFSANIFKIGSYVKDKVNNLQWQDTRSNIIMIGSQEKANEYCEQLSLGGYTNWRLPSKDEYEYVTDKTRKDEQMMHKAFKYVIKDDYWTSSRTWRSFGRYGYYFYVKSGTLYYENRSYPKFFRCVRDSD